MLDKEKFADLEEDWGPDYWRHPARHMGKAMVWRQTVRDRTKRVRNYLTYTLQYTWGSLMGLLPHTAHEMLWDTAEVLDRTEKMGDNEAIDVMLDHLHKWTVRTDPSCGPYQGS